MNINNDKIVSGVSISGIEVSGLSKEEAKGKIEAMYQEKKEEEIVLNLEQLERQTIEKAMKLSEGNISRAADYLGITRFALYRKLEKLGL